MICPCKDCSDRSPTCHSECKRYIDWKNIHNEEQQRLRDIKYTDNDFYSAKQYAMKRSIKNHRSRKSNIR